MVPVLDQQYNGCCLKPYREATSTSTPRVSKVMKPVPTHGYSSSHIPGRYSTATPVERGAGSADSTDLPAVRGSGAGRGSEEVDTDSRPETGVFGFSGRYSQSTADLPSREAEENKTASSTPPSPTECYGEGHSEVCWEGFSIDTSCMANSPSLQSTVFNQLGVLGESLHGDRRHDNEIQCHLDFKHGGPERSEVVVCSGQESPTAVSPPALGVIHDHIVGCLQHGVGSPTRPPPDRWEMVPRGSHSPYKLSRTASCVSSTTVLCQAQQWGHNSDEVGQCHSGDILYINKLGGTHSQILCQLALKIWDWCIQRDVLLVAEHLPGKDNITADRELRSTKDCCDWMLNPWIFNQIQWQMDPLQIDLFAS